MKNVIRKLTIFTFIVAMMLTVAMPATRCWARPRPDFVPAPSDEALRWEPLTPAREKEQEKWYWHLIFQHVHTDPAYYRGRDGFKMRAEISYAAQEILETEEGMPESYATEDKNISDWMKHYANFCARLINGDFSKREMKKMLRYEWRHYGKW